MNNQKAHIVIAESAPVVAAGLAHTIRRLPGLQCSISEIAAPDDLDACMKESEPDLLIIDPSFGGLFDPTRFRDSHPGEYHIAAIELAQLPRQTQQLYDAAISILDDVPTLSQKIRTLTESEPTQEEDRGQLSQREKEIVALVVKGMTNKEIADKLFLSPHTVITHRRNIARKLEIHSATGLTIYAIVNHIVDLADLNL